MVAFDASPSVYETLATPSDPHKRKLLEDARDVCRQRLAVKRQSVRGGFVSLRVTVHGTMRAVTNSIAKVVVDLSLDREFDYRIPSQLVETVHVGSPVR